MTVQGEAPKVLKKEEIGHVELTIKISADKMTAFADIAFIPGKPKLKFGPDTLANALKTTFQEDFLNYPMIEALTVAINSGKTMLDKKIANGKPVIEGDDAKFESILKAVLIPGNSEDTRFVKEIQRVIPGMILGIIHPPSEGSSGCDLFGTEVKAKHGKPFKEHLDRTLMIKPSIVEGGVEYLLAKGYGFFGRDQDKLKIFPLLQIKKDVDITSGNVNCNCAASIGGDVSKGSSVSARDDIVINGACHGSSICSQRGSIKANGLVLGGPGISVSAGGNVNLYMIQNLNIAVDGNIIIGKDARDSSLQANGCILMKQGHFFGGQALALGGIEAAIIGSEGGTQTIVGSKARAEVEAEVQKLSESISAIDTAEEELAKRIAPIIAPDSQGLPPLEALQCKKINDIIAKLDELRLSREITQRKVAGMQEALKNPCWFQLNYLQVLHKGTVIKVGEDRFIVDPYLIGPGTIEYHHETHEFKQTRYKELPAVKAMKKAGSAP